MYTVKYNDYPLEQYATILKVIRTVLPERTNFTKEIPSVMGDIYQGFKYNAKGISLECLIEADDEVDLASKMRTLATVLNAEVPKRLYISDAPNKYNYAVLEGSTEIERIKNTAKIQLNFVCHDPYTYDDSINTFDKDDTGSVIVSNHGSVPASPIVSVEFTKPTYFFQATKQNGESLLLGQRPNVDKPQLAEDTKVLTEDCTNMAFFAPASAIPEAGYVVQGNVNLNGGASGIMPIDFGNTEKGWHGPAIRRNGVSEPTDFEAVIHIRHDSKGDTNGTGNGSNPPSSNQPYRIKVKPNAPLRSARSASVGSTLTTIPYNRIVYLTEIKNGYGKTEYNGKIGFVSTNYVEKFSTAPDPTGDIEAIENVQIRSDAGTKYKVVQTATKGTRTEIKGVKDGWYRVEIGGKTGYTFARSWKKLNNKKATRNNYNSVENQAGRIHVYGMDRNGKCLFKVVVRDSELWYEYTQPECFIGTDRLVLDDSKATPTPNKVYKKDEDGKKVIVSTNSGKFGDWNDLYAKVVVRRQTRSSGNQAWYFEVNKVVYGEIAKTIKTRSMIHHSFPKENFSHFVIWFGQSGQVPPTEVMNVTQLEVKSLRSQKVEEIKPIFNVGDRLVIDHEKNQVTLNDIPYMQHLDIGSVFFECGVGNEIIKYSTDDSNARIETGLQAKWI